MQADTTREYVSRDTITPGSARLRESPERQVWRWSYAFLPYNSAAVSMVKSGPEVRSTTRVVGACDALRWGPRRRSVRVRPHVEMGDQLVEVVPERIDDPALQLVGAHLDLLAQRMTHVRELLVVGHGARVEPF